MRNVLVIGHRGAPTFERENTIKSFQKAIELGCDMVELDVRKTFDDMLVVHHDASIGRRKISNLTFQEATAAAKIRGCTINTLEEVLQLTREKIKLDLEFKESGYEQEVVELVLKYFKPEDFVVTSFIYETVIKIKNLYPQIRVGLLVTPKFYTLRETKKISRLIFSSKILDGIDFLFVHWSLWKHGWLNFFKNDKPLYIWTVNNEKNMKKLLMDDRFEGIITDKPDVLIKIKKNL